MKKLTLKELGVMQALYTRPGRLTVKEIARRDCAEWEDAMEALRSAGRKGMVVCSGLKWSLTAEGRQELVRLLDVDRV